MPKGQLAFVLIISINQTPSRLSETLDLVWDTYSQNFCKFQVKFDVYDLVLSEHIRDRNEAAS